MGGLPFLEEKVGGVYGGGVREVIEIDLEERREWKL